MPGMNNNGFASTFFSANTAGTQVFSCNPNNIAANVPNAQGLGGILTIGADTTATTITMYDGTSTGGIKKFQVTTPTAVPVTQLIINIQFTTGCFIVISGGTTPNITFAWL